MHIYKITNTVNGKIYIGQTVQKNPKMRWYSHLDYARKGIKAHLYDSMRKYGVEKFNWEILQEASNINELNVLENYWENFYRNQGAELYNNRQTGNNKLHSEESKQKMAEAQKAAHARRRAEGKDGGWKRKDGGAMKGKAHPNKGKSNSNKGKKSGLTWEEIYGIDGAKRRRDLIATRKMKKIQEASV